MPRASKDSSANLGFEARLRFTADKLRNNMDAAEYRHVVLGLIFLKYIPDTFEEMMPRLVAELHAQFAESATLEQAITGNLRERGYCGWFQHQRCCGCQPRATPWVCVAISSGPEEIGRAHV